MFILNDVNLSNYGRGRDLVKRKSRNNLLRNTAIGVGGLALAGGLGYMALRGKGKSVTKPPVTNSPVVSAKRKANSELVKRRKQLLDEENKKNVINNYQHKDNHLKEKLKKEDRHSYWGWESQVSDPSKPYIKNNFYSITDKPVYASYKNNKYRDSIIREKKLTGAAIKQIARNLRRDNRYFSRCSNLINLIT